MTIDPFDFLKDLEGIFGSDANAVFEKLKLEKLIGAFEEEVDKKNKDFLMGAVVRYNSSVETFDDNDLYKAHAMAAVLVDNFSLAYSSLKKFIGNVKTALPNLTEALGLLAYQTRRFKEAKNLIGDDPFSDESLITSVCAEYETGNKKVTVLQKKLGSNLKTSAVANSIIGKLYFEKNDFEKAGKFFNKAVELKPENENVRLNYFVNELQKGTNVYPEISAFYVETGSALSAEELNSRLDGREIKIDLYKPTTQMFSIFVGLGL
ncbi:MAG: hypothetical protein ABIB43_04225 [archaeon]